MPEVSTANEANAAMNTKSRHAERPRMIAWLGLAACLGLAGADGPVSLPSDPQYTALRTDGTTVSGRVRRIDVAGAVALAVDDSERIVSIPAGSLVKLSRDGDTSLAAGEGGTVLFPGGDRLARCGIGPAGETTVEVQSEALGTLAIPLESILGLVLAPPLEPDAAFSLESKIRTEPRSSEVLWLANGDRLAGGLLALGEKTVAFQPTGGKVVLERPGIVALGFEPKLVVYPRPEGPYLDLTFVDGSRVGVTAVQLEGGQILATTRYGQPIKLPLGELAELHARNGTIVYLSELEPAGVKYVGYLGPTRELRRDEAVDGQPLRLAGKAYDRGLGMQSRTYVVYRLPPGAKRFQSLVGLDDRAGPLGNVVFRVVVDKDERFATPPMSARDAPRPVDVDLTGAKALVLIADFGERGEVRDHADWVEARLIR
jgi:hypothetical protein